MGGALTVSERILFHLNGYLKYEDKYEVPFDVTQDGIAQACSISRAHAAIELKKLKFVGLVDERLSHVRRGKARRKAYFLTVEGKKKALDVVQYASENGIQTLVDPKKVTAELSAPRPRRARRSSPLPTLRYFFGREKDLSAAREALGSAQVKILSIRGIPGIGKTTLAARLAGDLTGQRIFWYSVKSWDTPRSVAEALGGFMSDNGSSKLSHYLAGGKFELSDLSFLLDSELSENGCVFVFDDVDKSDSLATFMSMLRHSIGSAKMVVTAESEPQLYDHSDVVARNEVFEIELQGLDKAAALELLGTRGITGELAEELARTTKGHPLSLEMVTETSLKEARHQVSRYFEERFYAGLSEDERALVQLASVFQKPFTADALPRELRGARKGSMLREVAPGSFEIHSSLREFVYGSMTDEERMRWHGQAADYYLKEEDPQERFHHLVKANRALEAEMLVARMGEEILGRGNVQRFWKSIESFEPSRPKYAMRVLLAKARAASIVGDLAASWALLERIGREGDRTMVSEAQVEMGRIMSKKGELDQALSHFKKALDMSTDDPSARAKAMRGMGVVENKLGNYAKAQELLEGSARDSMAVMDQKGMLLAHLELGNVYIGRGKYEEAIDHFSKCAAGFGPVELTNVYVNMGIAYAHLGKDDEARRHLENAVRLADDTGQPRAKAYALTSLAEVLIKAGDPAQAKEHCFGALEVFGEVGDRLGASAAYANLGMAERRTGNIHGSEEYYLESLSSLEGMDVPWSLGVRMLEYGAMLAEKGDRAKAEKMLRDSKRLFEKIGAKDMLSKVDSELKALR